MFSGQASSAGKRKHPGGFREEPLPIPQKSFKNHSSEQLGWQMPLIPALRAEAEAGAANL